jgi:hypothetical protein
MFHVIQHEIFMLYEIKLLWQLVYLKAPFYLTHFFYSVSRDFSGLITVMYLRFYYYITYTTICHVVNAGSRRIIEVKQQRARSVIGWVTAVKKLV